MQKKRMMLIGSVAFIFSIILFTVIFLAILRPDAAANNELTMGAAPPPSSYAALSYGDLSSLILIIAMFAGILYFILKA